MFLLPGKRGEKHRLSDFNAVYYCIIARTVCQPSFFKKGKKFFAPFSRRAAFGAPAYIIRKGNRPVGVNGAGVFLLFLAFGYGVSGKDMI